VYAIIDSGGGQTKVEPGKQVTVSHRAEATGESVTFDNVLLVATDDGTFISGSPHVAGAKVIGVIEGEVLDNKVRVFIKKRRKGMRRTIGHRTKFTQVRITDIKTK
jgi:large subunit ribosomal protein L21